jgi:hypothetical protein
VSETEVAAFNVHQASLRVDLDTSESAEIEDDPVIDGACASDVVAASADRQAETQVPGDAQDRDDVVSASVAPPQRALE